jgi:hypothetical protein
MNMKWIPLILCLLATPALAANPIELFPGTKWQTTGDLDSTTDVVVRAATPNVQHCVTNIQVSTKATLGSAQVLRLLTTDAVIWNLTLNTAGLEQIAAFMPTPVCAIRGEALEIDVDGDPTDDLIFYNMQGYSD